MNAVLNTPQTARITLYYREGSSDKGYHAVIEPQGAGFVVNFAYGRRGSTMNTGTKTESSAGGSVRIRSAPTPKPFGAGHPLSHCAGLNASRPFPLGKEMDWLRTCSGARWRVLPVTDAGAELS